MPPTRAPSLRKLSGSTAHQKPTADEPRPLCGRLEAEHGPALRWCSCDYHSILRDQLAVLAEEGGRVATGLAVPPRARNRDAIEVSATI
jgi:hypothetical protein